MTLVERETPRPLALPGFFDPYEEISKKAEPRWDKAVWVGYFVIIAFFGGFGGFAAFAPLHSAIMAQAQVRIDNERKVVQHPEGGIVTEIHVREGQRVEKGDVLLRLDPTRDRAQANALRKRTVSALAERARLIAERDELNAIEFPEQVLAEMSDPEIAEIVEGQRTVFQSRRSARDGQVSLILGQIDQARAQIASVQDEREAVREQLSLIDKELEGVRELYKKGLERQPRLLALERGRAGLKAMVGRLTGSIAQLEKQINELELRIVQSEREFNQQVVTRLDEVTTQIQALAEQRPVISASVERLELRAPRSGRIIDLKVHTVGQVIGRDPVMQIVPEDEDLVVIARVSPRDIDALNAGVAKVQVRLTSFSQRFTHPIEAHLESISSDAVVSEDGVPYYRAIMRLDPASREHVLPGVELTSGMPATAMIGVGERTLLDYLIEPLYRSVEQSLREP